MFLSIFQRYPELIDILKPKKQNAVLYGKYFDSDFIDSIVWIYENWFSMKCTVFIPTTFDYPNGKVCTFSSITEYNDIVIFVLSDIICSGLIKNNKRRLFTELKKMAKKSKIIFLSFTSLMYLQLPVVCEYTKLGELENMDFSFLEFDDVIDFMESNKDKHVYSAFYMSTDQLLHIESTLKERDIRVSRKEMSEPGVVLQSSKTLENSTLKNKYDIYILFLPKIEEPIDLVPFIKNAVNSEIYFNSEYLRNISESLRKLMVSEYIPPTVIQDSGEFKTYAECVESLEFEPIVVTEGYYTFSLPETLRCLDLENLHPGDCKVIRMYIKQKMLSKFDIDAKTCQLSYPSSPKDRSRKLNSLSNKISSLDYRCEITCEIFRDYSVGVITWNEMFSDRVRKNIKVLKNQNYIYQTTSGMWKYTAVS